MKKLIFMFLLILPLNLFSQNTRSLNFECGGYVTGLYVGKNTTNNLNQQILYAKTDIGGVYRSSNNGTNWINISSNIPLSPDSKGLMKTELITQGFSVNPDNPNEIILCWGDNNTDGSIYEYRQIWRSSNGGQNWILPTPGSISEGVNFWGDNFDIKTGGECIIYNPIKNITTDKFDRIIMGGKAKPDQNGNVTYLFFSENSGATWTTKTLTNSIKGETVISIAMHKDFPDEIWVGTTHALYRSTNYGNSWTRWTQFTDGSGTYNLNYSRRILLRNKNGSVMAFIAHSNGINNHGITRFHNGNWKNLMSDFNSGITTPPGSNNNFSTLMFIDGDENKLLAGRLGRPIRMTTNDGDNWSGPNGGQFLFYQFNDNTYPNHQIFENFAFTGLSHIVQNLNKPEWFNNWYVSGGAGARKSTNAGANWSYMTSGMNMPVVYDISFEPGIYSYIQTPISDWTNGVLGYNGSKTNQKLSYDRHGTQLDLCLTEIDDTYIPNVSRALVSPYATSYSYNIGGDVYYNRAKMYRRKIDGGNVDYQQMCVNAPWLNREDRVLTDGLVYLSPFDNASNNKDRFIVLLGKSSDKAAIGTTGNEDLGIYWGDYNRATNDYSFSYADFDGPNGEDQSSQEAYENSLMPTLGNYTGTVGQLFSYQVNLAHGPKFGSGSNAVFRKYLYLESQQGVENSGGLFVSDANGVNWQRKSNVVESGTYKDEGCMKYTNYNKLFIAIKNRGLYYTNDPGLNGNWPSQFTKDPTFKSALQVEAAQVLGGNKLVYVYGKKQNDDVHKLYMSTNDGQTWTSDPIIKNISAISSLKINPNPCQNKELWIGTSGMGVIIYTASYQVNLACATIVHESIEIGNNTEFSNDVIVQNNAEMKILGNSVIKFSDGAKLIIEEGAKLIVDNQSNVTFTKSDDASSWGGIEFRGTAKGIIKNAVFENCQTAINIVSGISEMPADTIIIENNTFKNGNIQISDRAGVKIVNNTFDYSTGNGQILSGVGSTASNNILIKDNIINYNENLTQTVGINIIYGNNVVIYNNQINNCHTGISASNSSPHIYFNQINFTSEGSTGISLDNSLSPVLKGNSITNYYTGINNYLSSPVMYKNNIQNELYSAGTGLSLIYNSIAKMEADNYENAPEWTAGLNEILLPNAGIGIFVDNYSYPVMKCSFNKVFGEEYIMKGKTNFPNMTIDAINNNWLRNPASGNDFDLDCGIDYETYSENIPDFNNSPNLFSIGFNIQDTLFKSDESSCPTENSGGENYLFYTANKFEREGNYSAAKQKYEQIVNEYRSGKYSKTSLKKILVCADKLNLSSADYSNLRNYYQTLRNNNLTDTSFANISEELSIKCLIRKSEFENAINEYENIVTSSSDSAKILNSQLNIIETYLIMSNQGDNLNSNGMTSYTGRIPALKPNSLKDAINKMNSILGRNKEQDNFTALPTEYELSQNYPNPFNPVTKINFNIPKDSYVKLKIYDMLGREIAILVNNEFKQPGRYTVEFNGSTMSSGIYFYRLETKDFIQTRKMVLVK
ncbi:MAG: T9SS type A sorting domain-containing protein [Ignavibacteria bacterium]|nr:T9SS type A sorting domain-containing protein [Ignavibacteria bacterium]